MALRPCFRHTGRMDEEIFQMKTLLAIWVFFLFVPVFSQLAGFA
jgi:hypothetical protein